MDRIFQRVLHRAEFLKKYVLAYIDGGITERLTVVDRRMVRLVNLAAVLGVLISLCFALTYFFFNTKIFLGGLLIIIGSVPFFAVAVWLNRKHHHLVAAILLNLCFTASLFLPLIFYLGNRTGNHYYFLMLAIVPLLTFKPKHIHWIVLTSALNIIAFYWIERFGTLGEDVSYYLPLAYVKGSKLISLYSSLFIVMFIVGMNQRLVITSETELSDKTISLKSAMEHLKELATIDSLTGVFNRTYFDYKIENEMAIANRYKTPLSLILVDLDYFKGINDTFGHDVGDMVLRTSSEVLSLNLRSTDALIRWGGEEFLVIAPQTDYYGAMQLAEKLRQTLGATPQAHFGTMTGSFGVTVFHSGDTFDDMYRRIDQALYHAKHQGRDRVVGIQ